MECYFLLTAASTPSLWLSICQPARPYFRLASAIPFQGFCVSTSSHP